MTSKKASNQLLPVGARVRVAARAGTVVGFGFEQAVRPVGDGPSVLTTRAVYLVRLDVGVDSRDGSMHLSVIVANPDNVKEA